MKVTHYFNSLHWIEQWTGTFFEAAWLQDVDLKLHLGHGGTPCPVGIENEDEDNSKTEDDEGEDDNNHSDPFPYIPLRHGRCLVVDTSGIHELLIVYCQCDGAEEKDIQLLRLRLWPASFIQIKTVFTFALLSDFRLENLAAKTIAYHYFQKL